MFPTFSGKGDLVVAEALPTLLDRIEVGECLADSRGCRHVILTTSKAPGTEDRAAEAQSQAAILASAQLYLTLAISLTDA
jgi:hypothetical protein